MEILMVLIAIVIVLASFGYNANKKDKNLEMWRAFAERNDGNFVDRASMLRNPANVGEVTMKKDDLDLLLDVRVESSGDNAVLYLRARTNIKQQRYIQIIRSTLIRQLTGGRIDTGYDDFDSRFVVFSDQELWAKRVVSLGVFLRQHFLASDNGMSINLEVGELTVESKGAPSSIEDLEKHVAFTLDVAKLLENTAPPELGYEAGGRLSLAEMEVTDGALTISSANAGAITSVEREEEDEEQDAGWSSSLRGARSQDTERRMHGWDLDRARNRRADCRRVGASPLPPVSTPAPLDRIRRAPWRHVHAGQALVSLRALPR